jgi:hypothetical protein
MKAFFEKQMPILPLVVFAMIAGQVLNTWVFVGVVHYDSQYSTLPKESYLAEVVTAEDYAKLQDRSLRKVELSNGTTIMNRQPIWYERVLPNYKRVDDQYICVTTLGTAHYCRRWFGDTIPLMLLAVLGLFVTIWDLRRRRKSEA